ncbi:MAG: hypothetical protein EBR30_26775 [Cytophagia bacterium]|nr:hypothetical protein [Cytophagia bacterium]
MQLDAKASGLTSEANKLSSDVVKLVSSNPTLAKKMQEYYVNSLISGLGTPVVNVYSAFFKGAIAPWERMIESVVERGAEGKTIREGLSMFPALVTSFAEAWRFAGRGFLNGAPLDLTYAVGSKDVNKFLENFRTKAIGTGKITTNADGTVTYVEPSKPAEALGELVRLPTRVSVAVDEFSKAFFRRMEINALKYRYAYGMSDDQFRKLNMRDNLDATPEEIASARQALVSKLQAIDFQDENWMTKMRMAGLEREAASITQFAKENTFQADLGKVGNTLTKLRNDYPLLSFVIPFIKTPINITKDFFRYTPGSALAYAGTDKFSNVTAKNLMGLATITSIIGLAESDLVTGHHSDKERATKEAAGIPEMSVKIGDTWYDYSRIEPVSSTLGFTLDVMSRYKDLIRDGKENEANKLVSSFMSVMRDNLVEKTFLAGIANFVMAATDAERYGPQILNNTVGSLVPAVVGSAARLQDPVNKEVDSAIASLKNRIPGLREELPTKFDILGKPKTVAPGQVLGLAAREAEQTPVQQLLDNPYVTIRPVTKRMYGMELDAEQLSRLRQLTGEAVERTLAPRVDALNRIEDPRVRATRIEKIVEKAREAGRKQFMAENIRNPEFREAFVKYRQEQRGVFKEDLPRFDVGR